MSPFFEILDVPASSCVLMRTRDEAIRYPRGDIVLGFCDDCGFICNLTFDTTLTEYSSRYEETQGYSRTFREFHDKLAKDLIDRYQIKGKDILEIGCGKGEFLALLCRLGRNRGTGFDPSFDENRQILEDLPDARVIPDFYSDKYSDVRADVVCCKMTLEHIPEAGAFARLACDAMRSDRDSLLYFLVPNGRRVIDECAFEDIYYEHCNYFTPGSLARLFRGLGLGVHRLAHQYANQYLALEAGPADMPTVAALAQESDLDEVRMLVATFALRCEQRMRQLRQELESKRSHGEMVVWGSGSKAVAFLRAVDRESVIERVVDINPHKHGRFMPGTGQRIVGPTALREHPPATIILMNPIYREEVSARVRELGLHTEILAL